MGLDTRKPVFGVCEQQRRRLINAFVIGLPKSSIAKLASSDFSIFRLVSEAEENCLSLTLTETPKTGFVASRPILYHGLWVKVFRIIPEFSILG